MRFGSLFAPPSSPLRSVSAWVRAIAPLMLWVTTSAAQETLRLDPIPEIYEFVPPTQLLGFGLAPHHYDAVGYPESYEGLLIVEQDPQAGPFTRLHGVQPYYLEAQFQTLQREAVWFARSGPIVDVLPNGTAYEIPYGYGAVKQSLSVLTLIEGQVQPHMSDDQKSYRVFPLEDVYLGATLSLLGVRADLRYVKKERYVGYAQAGLNLLGMAGANVNRTYDSFAVPIVVGGGLRYPSPLSFIGNNWTTGLEAILGLGSIDDDPKTANVVFLPGLFHEVEWTFPRAIDVVDYRLDARPSNYGVQSLYAKVGAYADFTGGITNSVVVDVHIGYRFNVQGPNIPHHLFKDSKVTYASQRYAERKLEERQRQTGNPAPAPPPASLAPAPASETPAAAPTQDGPAPYADDTEVPLPAPPEAQDM